MNSLGPSNVLLHSKKPLTKPKGPSFVGECKVNQRKQACAETKVAISNKTAELTHQRENERKYLKAQYEFEREKNLAERVTYQKEIKNQWTQRLSSSPFAVNLVADKERIEEENTVRDYLERKQALAIQRKKRKLKNQIIRKALAEIDNCRL
eukprot:Tbor_TRINITY_DN1889_c0_g1::TRINITY_DN1889_c0_g1_i1::g.23008::m.23008